MYKTKLQELCHQHSWVLPEYRTVKDGPDHMSRFTAGVVVNGVTFETVEQSRTSKEAQNQAAKLAFDHFTAPKPILQHSPLSPVAASEIPLSAGFSTSNASVEDIRPAIGQMQPIQQGSVKTSLVNNARAYFKDDKKSKDVPLHQYKSLLQNYIQKRNLTLPVYSCNIDGPPHVRCFKSTVTIDGKVFETIESFPTLKEAEHAAAKVAFESLSSNAVQEDEGLYKNLLQELSQKEGFNFPSYETIKSGLSHMPSFVSTVEAGGKIFQGQESKTKKQAEMNAAKVAYFGLMESRAGPNPPVAAGPKPEIRQNANHMIVEKQAEEDKGTGSTSLHSIIAGSPQPEGRPNIDHMIQEQQTEEDKGKANEIPIIPSPASCLWKEDSKVSSSCVQFVATDDLPQSSRQKAKFVIDEEQDAEDKGTSTKRQRCLSSSDMLSAPLQYPLSSSSPQNGLSTTTTRLGESTNSIMETDIETPAGAGTLDWNRVLVYPCTSNMTFSDGQNISDGATVLPISDDKWIAVRVDLKQNPQINKLL